MPEPSLGSSVVQNSPSWFVFLIIHNLLEFPSLGSHKLQSFRYLPALFLASSKPCISHLVMLQAIAQEEAVESLRVPARSDTSSWFSLQAGRCAWRVLSRH